MNKLLKWVAVTGSAVAIIIIILTVAESVPKKGEISLLAVTENEGKFSGSIANLELEMRPGSGRVFLETFPLAKIDSQMSVRHAKSTVCKALDRDCSIYDFFYTIRANSGILGGPSAGSAAAVLTASLLTGKSLDKSTAITGTINSGGLIGPVGGLKEKISAARDGGLTKVIIPQGTRQYSSDFPAVISPFLSNNSNDSISRTVVGNGSIDLVVYGKSVNISVIEVGTLSEALEIFSGKMLKKVSVNVQKSDLYSKKMRSVATNLCNRAQAAVQLANETMQSREITEAKGKENLAQAQNFTANAAILAAEEKFYSAASFCFRANVLANALVKKSENKTPEDYHTITKSLMLLARSIQSNVNQTPIRTIVDLQTRELVDERLEESIEILKQMISDRMENKTNDKINGINETVAVQSEYAEKLAFAEERLYSAGVWSTFFGLPGKKFSLSNKVLERACKNKVIEADEYANYVKIYMPSTQEQDKGLKDSFRKMQAGNHLGCLFGASKVKAEYELLLGAIGIEKGQANELLALKLGAARKNIQQNIEQGNIPIIGLSYVEYADSLGGEDVFSALLFAEYALELSNLDIYFKPAWRIRLPAVSDQFWYGLSLGIISVVLIVFIAVRKPSQTDLAVRLRGKKR